MKNKFDDNNEDFGGGFPKPGVPADDAWKQMHALLEKHHLTQPAKKDRRRWVALLFIFFMLIGAGGLMYFNKGDKPLAALSAKKENHPGVLPNKAGNTEAVGQQIKTNKKGDVSVDKSIQTTKAPAKNYSLTSMNKRFSINNTAASAPAIGLEKSVQDATSATGTTQEEKHADVSATGEQTGVKQVDPAVTASNNTLMDTTAEVSSIDKASSGKTHATAANKFHFGLQWNVNFSLKNNSHYFDDYYGSKQYYMWALPAAWAKIDIGRKHGMGVTINPYKQVFAGKQIVQVQTLWIASVDPDIVTRAVKTRGFNLGLQYEYRYNRKLGLSAGLSYTWLNNILYAEQAVEHSSGNVLSEKVFAAKRDNAAFDYVKSSFANWNASLKYDLRKLSIGAGISQPLQNLSADPAYTLKPLNAELYLQYRFK